MYDVIEHNKVMSDSCNFIFVKPEKSHLDEETGL